MKIGILINDITRTGGTEKITTTLSDVFCRNGHDVAIVSCYKSNDCTSFHFNEDVDMLYLSRSATLAGRMQRIKNYVSLISELRRVVRREKFDVLLCQSFPMSFMGITACRGTRTKAVACEHTSYDYYGRGVRLVSNAIYRFAGALVVINSSDKEIYDRFCRRVFMIPNIVGFDNGPRQLASCSRNIVSVGRLEHHKGFDRLIEAMRAVVSRHNDAVLHIYGDGGERDVLRRQIDSAGLSSNVLLHGFCTDPGRVYAGKAFYVLPSRIEGFGLVLVEAASFGLPLIAFDCPNGPRDILADDGGILVADNDVAGLADAMVRLLEDGSAWLHYRDRSRAIPSRYSEESIYPLWRGLFESLPT